MLFISIGPSIDVYSIWYKNWNKQRFFWTYGPSLTAMKAKHLSEYKNTRIFTVALSFSYFGGFFYSDWRIFKQLNSNYFPVFSPQLWCSINLCRGHVKSHTKFGPDQFSRLDVYWIQTDDQKLSWIQTKSYLGYKPKVILDTNQKLSSTWLIRLR